ncbi:MAG: hypothetical protein C6I00_02445 [Nitratiruptor sp.]|nr:hypothetical protein [Nitratiruptor sp.]NPA84145.1 hypothetical protein [Campylobacterota bacterium]
MQRSGYDAQTLKRIAWLLGLLLFYEPLTTIYVYLPPLLGVMAWYFLQGRTFERIGALLYLYIFEIDHSLPFMSLFIALLFYQLAMRWLFRYVACPSCTMALSVLFYYLILEGVLLFYGQILGVNLDPVDPLLLGLYIILDLMVLHAL